MRKYYFFLFLMDLKLMNWINSWKNFFALLELLTLILFNKINIEKKYIY